jgi:hypothetical protein
VGAEAASQTNESCLAPSHDHRSLVLARQARTQPVEIDGRFYEEKLIHRTSRREMVRSKSEVIIADRLAAHGIDYAYEESLTIGNPHEISRLHD